MANQPAYPVLESASSRAESRRHLARRAGKVALGLLIVAALAGAWLVFFTYFPLDFTPPRPA